MGTAVALAFLAAVLLLATLWTVEVGTGEELDPNFELGPLGPDRVVAQELRVREPDMVGLQVAARAEGTLRPLMVQADLLAGDTVIATRMLQVFPSTTFQLRRVAFDRAASPGPVVVRFQALAGQAGGVVYGATREDRQPDGDLRLDGQVEFADQDLALRVLYRRSLWTACGIPGRRSASRARGRGPHPRGHGGRPRPVGDRSNSFFASESSQRSTQPAMTTPEKTAGRDRAGRRRVNPHGPTQGPAAMGRRAAGTAPGGPSGGPAGGRPTGRGRRSPGGRSAGDAGQHTGTCGHQPPLPRRPGHLAGRRRACP